MPYYKVLLIHRVEWKQYYEANSADEAIEMARMEIRHGTVVDEQVEVELVDTPVGTLED